MQAHQVGSLEFDVGLGDGKLHALVLSDGATEYHPVAGIVTGFLNEPTTIADAFRSDQGAFRIEAIEDVAEALALLADQVACGDLQ